MPMPRIVRRVGFTVKRLRGVRREGGPAAVAPDQHWDVRNMLPVGGELHPRGGQTKLNSSLLPNVPATEFFNGMFDEVVGGASVGGCGGGGGVELLPGGDGPKVYWGDDTTATRYVYFWDAEKTNPDVAPNLFRIDNTAVLRESLLDPAQAALSFSDDGGGSQDAEPPCLWNGLLYFPVVGSLSGTVLAYGIYSMPTVSGNYRPGLEQRFLLSAVTTNVFQYNGLHPWRGKLWFGRRRTDTTGIAPDILSWDGVGLPVVADTPGAVAGTKPRAVITDFKDSLYAAYDDLPNIVRRITAAGAASNMAGMPSTGFKIGLPHGAGTGSFGGHSCFATYKNALYLAGRDATGAVIYATTDGATFGGAAARSIGGGAISVCGLYVFNGYLYYIYKNATTCWVGRYDGTTWDDTHSNRGLSSPCRLFVLDDTGKKRLAFTGIGDSQRSNFSSTASGWLSFGTSVGNQPTPVPNY